VQKTEGFSPFVEGNALRVQVVKYSISDLNGFMNVMSDERSLPSDISNPGALFLEAYYGPTYSLALQSL
jgi:hypothetical protein